MAAPGWQDSYEQARDMAEQQQVPLLLHFHASYCGPCRTMDRTVFSAPGVQRALQDGLVAVKVDTAQRDDLKERYGANTIPRDVVVYPDGSVETLSVGLVPRASYLAILRETAARGRAMLMTLMEELEAEEAEEAESQDVPTPRPVQARVSPVELPSQVAEASEADENQETEADDIVGLSGYCPVMLTGRREWVAGREDLTQRYRGVLYQFSAEAQRDEFLRNPDRYAPRNLGCDPVVLVREQRAVTGRIRYGAFFDGKLYLFRTAESRREFKRQPLRYTRVQHAVKSTELSGQTFQ